ncbi:testis-specific H1 histone [Sminthopsis crassicaudata]|uniref:testis-specific H1 histone n=1 Tax=Sminthopsis crassicaudata TaxID=9301 RepID=UPI003D68E528
MVKSQTSRPAVAGAGSTMTEAADPDGVSKEIVPESSEKSQDTQVRHRRRSVLRVSQLLLRAIAAHKGLTLTALKKEFGNAGYQVRRKCSRHSSEVPKPASVKATLLRVSGSKAEGYFRVWKSLKPIKKRTKKPPAEIEEVQQKRFDSLFSRRYRKRPQELSQPNLEDSSKPEMFVGSETPEMSETPHTSEERICVEQENENPENIEEVALSTVSGYSLSQKASKKMREEMRHKAKQQKIKKMKMKMKEKTKSQMGSAEGSKRSRTKKEKKRRRIKENKRAKINEDKKMKSKEKAKEKVREKNFDPEKREKHTQSRHRRGFCKRYSPNRNPASAKLNKIRGGRMKALEPRARRPYKVSPRKDSSRRENSQRIGGHP